jgi:hypothetical protein
MMRAVLSAVVAAVIGVPAGALAEDQPAGEDEPPAGKAVAAEASETSEVSVGKAEGRMTAPGGKILLQVIVETNLAKDVTFKPISIAPDLWIGLADKLTFGIVHSGRATTGFLTGSGRGVCLNGGEGKGVCALGLGKIYTHAGAEARIGLLEGGFALALDLGVHALTFKPDMLLAGKGGLIARIQAGPIAFELAPSILVGLNKRTIEMDGVKISNNGDRVSVPVTLFIQLGGKFAIALQSGATFPLKKAADNYQIPAAVGLVIAGSHFSFDVAFGLDAALDKNDMTKAFDARSLSVGVGYAL